MSSGAVHRNPSERDYRDAIKNLMRVSKAGEADVRRAYETAHYHFPKAVQLLEAEARKAKQTAEAREFQQALLFYRYRGQMLPAIQEWAHTGPRFDPMTNPTDTYLLIEALIERGVDMEPARDGEHIRLKLRSQTKQGRWYEGEGLGDNLREAVVLAWWNTFGEDYS